MQFTSVVYLAFLALATAVYYVLPGARTRATWLLTLSVAFYALLSPEWLWVLLAVTAFTWMTGLGLQALRVDDGATRLGSKLLLAAGIVVIAGALVVFKYLGFFAEVGNGVLKMTPLALSLPTLRLLLPVGVSFWTFQSIAYLVDIYRGRTVAERNPLYFSVSVVFFPIVTAGPITRVQTLVPQLRRRHRFDPATMQSGLLLIGRGFFKKLMVADRLAVFVATVFDDPRQFAGTEQGLVFAVAAAFFAIQLYCDFSGYTDIVRGSARLFGVELPLNFTAPYFARSVKEFWRRWHMTLMDWLKDYVYIPLGGNRKGEFRRHANTMAVFLVSGLWHGAGLSFIAWGALNGAYLIVGELTTPVRDRFVSLFRIDRSTGGHRAIQTLITFGLVTFAWVFFRANSIQDALFIAQRMFIPTVWIFTDGTMVEQGLSFAELMVALLSTGVVWATDWLSLRTDLLAALNRQSLMIRWAVYYALIFSVVVFGHYGGAYDAASFVYFKF